MALLYSRRAAVTLTRAVAQQQRLIRTGPPPPSRTPTPDSKNDSESDVINLTPPPSGSSAGPRLPNDGNGLGSSTEVKNEEAEWDQKIASALAEAQAKAAAPKEPPQAEPVSEAEPPALSPEETKDASSTTESASTFFPETADSTPSSSAFPAANSDKSAQDSAGSSAAPTGGRNTNASSNGSTAEQPKNASGEDANNMAWDAASMKARIPDEYHKQLEDWRAALDKKARELAKTANTNFTLLGRRINEVTGYREVEQLKDSVKTREIDLADRRREARIAKKAYDEAVTTRTTSQADVNNLLERKHSWTDADVAKFTQLVRSDHSSRHSVTETAARLQTAELLVDKAFTALMQSILERYHEEQVWSDKIRSVSTWAQLAVLAANLIVFMSAIVFIEPWKRRRLVDKLEEQVKGMMSRVEGEIRVLADSVDRLDANVATSGVAPLAIGPSAVQAVEEVAESMPLPPLEAESPSPASNDSRSPLEHISASVPADSPQGTVLIWATAQLTQIAAPSPERDLAAATAVGVVGGALAVGVMGLIGAYFRSH